MNYSSPVAPSRETVSHSDRFWVPWDPGRFDAPARYDLVEKLSSCPHQVTAYGVGRLVGLGYVWGYYKVVGGGGSGG